MPDSLLVAPDAWQRRRDLVADEIETIALALFAERGYDEVTVQDIADAAGMAARTFYRYFPTKADVLHAHRDRLFERLHRALLNRPDDEPPTTALRESFVVTASISPGDESRVVAIGRLLHDPASLRVELGYEAVRTDDLVAVMEQRRRRPASLALRVEVSATLAAAQMAFRTWLADDRRVPLPDRMRAAFRALDAIGSSNPNAR
jgi:AcrR family transcriptional regulator